MGTITLDGIDFPVREASFATVSSGLVLEVNGGHADVPQSHDWWILEPRLLIEAGPFVVDPSAEENVFAVDHPHGDQWLFCLETHEQEWVTRAEVRLVRTGAGHRLSASGEATIQGAPVSFRVETEVRWSS
jgi:hypothetical protein